MALLLLLSLLAPVLNRGEKRRVSLLFLLVTVTLLAAPVFISEYDYRFTIPAFGPLAATAAFGGWAVAVYVRARIARAPNTDALWTETQQSESG